MELSDTHRRAGTAASASARRQRADLRRGLNRGWVSFDQLLAAPEAAGLLVVDVLTALPGVGKVTASRLMMEARVSPRRRVQGLGRVQRERLGQLLGP